MIHHHDGSCTVILNGSHTSDAEILTGKPGQNAARLRDKLQLVLVQAGPITTISVCDQ